MTTLFKQFATDIKALADSRTIKFLISTDTIDRDGDSIDPKGWDLDNYKRSPVVLWSHDYSQPPVAKATSIEQTANGLAAVAEFPAKGVYPFADTVYELLKGGFLSASSVGFRPIDGAPAEGRKGMNYSKQELLEFSVVPVPANPEALVQMSIDKPECKGLAKDLVAWSEKFLGEYYGERGVWLPASQVEKTFEAIMKSGVLLKTKQADGTAEAASGTSSTGECLPKEVASETLELADDVVLELTDDVFEVEAEMIQAGVRAALTKTVADAMTYQLNYMRGRVV
jgi:HK97 family phage prohead protease